MASAALASALASTLASSRFLLVTPCDPGNCHIYFSVQRKTLSTAISLARATGRTLVLPPFEWYENQAQTLTNTFKLTPAGQRPKFVPFSDLFDLPRLRKAGVDAVEYHELPFDGIDRAFLQAGSFADAAVVAKTLESPPPEGDTLSNALQYSRGCKMGRDGLQANLTWADGKTARATVEDASGMLYERRLRVGTLRCGTLPLNQEGGVQALSDWFGDVAVAAVFDVGHHTHTKVEESGVRALLHGALRPSTDLTTEAEAHAPASPFVAVHWRHGDYFDYKILMSASTAAKRVVDAMAKLDGCPGNGCAIFLMTNCRNVSALSELREALPAASPLVTYTPSGERYAEEGRRLVIEQAIAARADAFAPSSRSAVSEWVEMLRHARLMAQRRPSSTDSRPKVEL